MRILKEAESRVLSRRSSSDAGLRQALGVHAKLAQVAEEVEEDAERVGGRRHPLREHE